MLVFGTLVIKPKTKHDYSSWVLCCLSWFIPGFICQWWCLQCNWLFESCNLYFGASIAIITKAFQGSMRIFSKKLPHPDLVSSIYVDKILCCYISLSLLMNYWSVTSENDVMTGKSNLSCIYQLYMQMTVVIWSCTFSGCSLYYKHNFSTKMWNSEEDTVIPGLKLEPGYQICSNKLPQ